MRRHGPLLCLAGIACGRAASPSADLSLAPDAGSVVLVPPPLPSPSASEAAVPPPNEPEVNVAARAAQWGAHAPRTTRVLYTWTTQEQLEIMRKGGPVLQRSFSPGKGFASFDHALYANVVAGNEPAKNLWHEGFAKSRFAWSNAFGAVAAPGGEFYGNVLLRITLKSEAALYEYYLEQGAFVWGAVNVPEAQIGGIWFSNNKYREYVLPNESMIDRVEAYTPSLRGDVERQLAFLRGILRMEEPVPAHILSQFFPHVQALASAEHMKAGIVALEALLRSTAAPFERQVQAKFVLGNRRAPIEMLCKKLRVNAESVRWNTFGKQMLYTPVCAVARPSAKAECHPLAGRGKDTSLCVPLPEFLE